MRLLLFGGTGFVSEKLLSQAIKENHKVIYITRGIKKVNSIHNAVHILADRDLDKENIKEKLHNERWDAVIDVICRTPDHARQAIDLSIECRRLIMISTDYVYDPLHRRLPQNEDEAVFVNADNYGGNKRKAELEIIKASETGIINATILRPPHIYGPGSLPGTIPKHGRSTELINDINKGKTLHLIQGGLGLIQPLYFNDLASIVLKLLPLRGTFGEIYNIPGFELMTHLDYYREIAKCLGKDLKVKGSYPEDDTNINHFPCGHRYYDNYKISQVLHNYRYTPFNDGVHAWVKEILKNNENGK